MPLAEAPQSRDEPGVRQRRQRADPQVLAAAVTDEVHRGGLDAIEGRHERREVATARLGEVDALLHALEERDAEALLESGDLLADGTRGDSELLGRAREAAVARGRFEGPESVKRRSRGARQLS